MMNTLVYISSYLQYQELMNWRESFKTMALYAPSHVGKSVILNQMIVFEKQGKYFTGARRHARENWNTIRYRYIHLFVRLEEGEGPGFKVWFTGEKTLVDGNGD